MRHLAGMPDRPRSSACPASGSSVVGRAARRRWSSEVARDARDTPSDVSEEDIEVIGEAADGAQAVCIAARSAPDVLLMDIRMPGVDGIEATRRIAANPDLTSVHVVILTTFGLDEYVLEGLRAGAAGFLVKDTDATELLRAVRRVAGGAALVSPAVNRR